MRPALATFVAVLLGVAALLLGFGIGVMVSEVLPDIVDILRELSGHATNAQN